MEEIRKYHMVYPAWGMDEPMTEDEFLMLIDQFPEWKLEKENFIFNIDCIQYNLGSDMYPNIVTVGELIWECKSCPLRYSKEEEEFHEHHCKYITAYIDGSSDANDFPCSNTKIEWSDD